MTIPKDISQSGQNDKSQPSAVPENASNHPNKTPFRDSYWFAHGGIEEVVPKNALPSSKSPGVSGDSKDAQLQKDKVERIRMFQEQQEEERLKRLKGIEQQFLQAKKHRELQEEERKRKIEEARIKEMERRQQVEERKRQIWEAEQERKEAILRRNMEREARIEARRNAQRNSQCFAFGSSTPRTFDLDLAAIGAGRNASPGLVLMSSISGRRSEERETGPPRATSACSLDRKFNTLDNADYSNEQRDPSLFASLEPSYVHFSNISKQIAFQHKSSNDMKACLSMWDSNPQRYANSFDSMSPGWLRGSGVLVGEDCMSRSMVSLSSSSAYRGRKRTDIMPTLTRERSITPHVTPRGNCARAVSMTRLDQLAQPRRPYRTMYPNTTTNHHGDARALSPSMTKSMVNLAGPPISRRMHVPVSSRQRGSMSQSMMHLAEPPMKDTRGLTPSPTAPKSNMRSAQSMMHLAAAPRLTRTARLRAEALAKSRAASAWNLNNPDAALSGRYFSPGKDTSRSPSRPQSSMSGASEVSATSSSVSAVNMRARSAPRRPRPYSIAGSTTERTPIVPRKDPDRQSRHAVKEAVPGPSKQPRAKSIGREKDEELSRPKKPLPPPKSKEVLARAKSHPVPVKDNLRKAIKTNTSSDSKKNNENNTENEENINVEDKENIQSKVVKKTKDSKSEVVAGIVNSSPLTSPVTDSEMCISSEDSRIMTESDVYSYTQTESEVRTEASESVNIHTEKEDVHEDVLNNSENIPPKFVQSINKNVVEQQNAVILEQKISQTNKQVVAEENQLKESNTVAAEQKSIKETVVVEQKLVEDSNIGAAEQKLVKDSNTSADEQKLVVKDNNTSADEQKLVVKDNNTSADEQKLVKDNNTSVDEQKLVVKYNNTSADEQKLVKDNNTSVDEQKLVVKDNNTSADEQKLVVEDSNTSADEQKLIKDGSTIAEQKPVKDSKTSVAEQRPVKEGISVVAEERTVSESENGVAREAVVSQKPRITSEEEARAALAEKRRLAREKAEREAELERRRQEEIRRQEEEQCRLEELEQKKMEEEQIRLAELHRQLEAEKLQKAIEEQKKREQEEREIREEEARQKAEKEELERKAREEAEKQRLELEERLRKEEEERAERKRRVEQIMARTRGKSNAQSPASTPSDSGNKTIKTEPTTASSTLEKLRNSLLSPSQDATRTNHILNGSSVKNSMSTSFTSNSGDNPFQTLGDFDMSKSYPLPDLLTSDAISNHCSKSNGHHDESSVQVLSSNISESNSFSSNRTMSANDTLSPTQTNGYSSHEDMSCTTSPEETSDGMLINVENSPQSEVRVVTDPSEFTRLVDIDQSSLNLNENYVISVDKVNSNIMSTEKSYTSLQKSDAHVVDLLS